MIPGALINRPPTSDQKAEAARVEGLQVRTNVASLATQMLAARGATEDEWVAFARIIETFIRAGAYTGGER